MNKQKLGFIVPILFVVTLLGGTAFAENGKLTIHNHVIYEKNKEKADSIEYQVAPHLFLENMTQANQEKSIQREKSLRLAKDKVFVSKQLPSTNKLEKLYEKKLYLDNYEGIHEYDTKQHSVSKLNQGNLIYIFALVILFGMLLIGIMLGRKFSKIFVRQN